MKFITAGSITLHVALDGVVPNRSVGTPLVLINSLGTDLRIWDGVLPLRDGHLPVIRYDKRGHGLSDAPAGPYTICQQTGDVEALLEHLEPGAYPWRSLENAWRAPHIHFPLFGVDFLSRLVTPMCFALSGRRKTPFEKGESKL